MLRGFGTATNATLKELLASDTDQAEDPGDGDDVDAFVRAASPLFDASEEPWTHESIKPPATPPRSPDGDGTDTDPFPPTPPSFQERAATATAALQRMLDMQQELTDAKRAQAEAEDLLSREAAGAPPAAGDLSDDALDAMLMATAATIRLAIPPDCLAGVRENLRAIIKTAGALVEPEAPSHRMDELAPVYRA